MPQILIRNIAESIIARIKDKATHNQRSMEAEAREALQSWVKNPILPRRLKELSERLQIALELASQTPWRMHEDRGGFTHADLAKGIGLELVMPVDQWFEGSAEPTMSQVEAIADWCGVSNEWLNFGRGAPYPLESHRIPLDPAEGAFWLLGSDNESLTRLKHLRFVRRDSKAGELMVVRQWGVKTDAFITPYHVSFETGAGGRLDLRHLLLVWKMLYQLYTKSHKINDLIISSHVVSDNIWNALCDGLVNRGDIFERSTTRKLWWEDIWDKKMLSHDNSMEYWPGWSSLCVTLQQEIESDEALRATSQQISDHTYPPLKKWVL